MSLISVIIPVYNTEKYIKECVISFLNQTYKDFELIFVNDSSTDKTVEIIKSFQDDRIKIYTVKKGGAGAARNFGLSKAKGEFIVFFDSDDFCKNTFLEKMIEGIKKTEADITICASCEYSEKKAHFSRHRISHTLKLLDKNLQNIPQNAENIDGSLMELVEPWNKIYRTSFLKEGLKTPDSSLVDGFKFQEINASNDTFFFYSTILSADKISCVFEELTYTRRGHKTSVSSNANKNIDDYFEAYKKTDEFVFKHKSFPKIMLPYFRRKFNSYRYFYKKVSLNKKFSYLSRVMEEVKKANEIIKQQGFNQKFSIFSILI